MDVGRIRRVIEDQRDEIERVMREGKMVEREGLDVARSMLGRPNVLVVLGVRRCGKSVFSNLTFGGSKYGYVNFEDERLAGIGTGDLDSVLEALYGLYGSDLDRFVFDEVQNIPRWESFVSRLRVGNRLIVTGSNARLLSSEVATALTGRHVDYTLFPFSFREFLAFHGADPDAGRTRDIGPIKRLVEEYVRDGGFPETYSFGKRMLRGIYDDIVERDVRWRFSVRKRDELRDVARYLIANSAREVSYNRVKNMLSLDIRTVRNYMDHFRTAYLLFYIEKFSCKLRQQILSPRKVYCVDTGLVGAVSSMLSEDAGGLMENCVAVQLVRERMNDPQMDVFYWKDYQHHEVDFVITMGSNVKQLIQVTRISSRDELDNRETRGLVKASWELRCKDLLIVTWDLEDTIKIEGRAIVCIPLWKWLLKRGLAKSG